eukprot:7260957-Ditylum_brightwellii.AAC.1
MACDVMPESESAKDDDMSSTKLKLDFVQQCYKNPKCLGLLKDYADKHQEVLSFYDEIEDV